jgi:hypothetical protein
MTMLLMRLSTFCLQLVFEGIVGTNVRGDIAIDDIKYVAGVCSGSTGKQYFTSWL